MLMKIKGDRHFGGCGGIGRQTDPADTTRNRGDAAQLRATLLARRVARLGQRFRNLGYYKDVKNADRSHDVYENKGSYDKITEKKSDIAENCA